MQVKTNLSIMKKTYLLLILFVNLVIIPKQIFAKEEPYFYEIHKTPEKYTAENVTARMVDGLGFRYFWASEGLRPEDLAYEPNDEARSTRFTLEHIYDLCNIIKQTTLKQEYRPDKELSKYSFEELRNKTLENLKIASKELKKEEAKLSNTKMVFTRPDGTKNPMEFWYLINGPISDALWHVGQVVSFRRSSGNPFPKGVSVLQGTKN
jgi:hypothetical protein